MFVPYLFASDDRREMGGSMNWHLKRAIGGMHDKLEVFSEVEISPYDGQVIIVIINKQIKFN